MKILLISDFFPDPRIPGGASTRVYHLLRELAKKHSITLLTTKWPGVAIDESTVKGLCDKVVFYDFVEKPSGENNGFIGRMIGPKTRERLKEIRHLLFEGPHMVESVRRHDASFRRALESLPLEEFDLIQIEDSYIAYRLFDIKKKYPRIPIVVDLHNVNALMEKRTFELAKGWRWRLYCYAEWRKMISYEKKIFRAFNTLITCSEEDRRIVQSMAPGARCAVVPNGVDTEVFKSKGVECEPNSIFFLGSNWPPNVDGILYFHKHIYPDVTDRVRDAKLYIIGNFKGNKVIESLAGQDTVITGYVNDVREWMDKGALSIVPLRMGGGTRLKILEALSMSKAIVSTSMGAEGIEAVSGKDIVLADDPQSFADEVVRLLGDEKARKELGNAGRKLVEEKYDWKVVGAMLNDTYAKIVNNTNKVLYFLDIFPTVSETFIVNEILELERQGFEITVFARRKEGVLDHGILKNLKARVIYLPEAHSISSKDLMMAHFAMTLLHPINYLRTLIFGLRNRGKGLFWTFKVATYYAYLTKRFKFSNIHSHFAGVASSYAMFVGKLLGKPFTFTIHGWYDLYEAPPKDMKERAEAAKKIVTISEYNKNYLVTKFKIPAEKIEVIHCGVDLEYFGKEIASGKMGQSQQLILSVARLHPVKDLETLIRACGRLAKQRNGFKCSIVGEGEERPRLERLISDMGLTATVALLGSKKLEEVRGLYGKASVYVLPSKHETMGVTTMEAMASGLPVISSNIYGIPELVDNGLNGFLISPGDDEQLAAHLKELLNDESKRNTFGERGRQKIEKAFNLETEVKKLTKVWFDGKN